MIVSNSRNFIFLKTRKCGGTSIQSSLKHICDSNDYVTYGWVNQINNKHSPIEEFATLKDIQTKLNIDTDPYFKFGIIRNPYAITLSRYMFHIKKGREKGPQNKENFNSWVQNIYFNPNGWYIKDKFSYFLFDGETPLVEYIMKLENIENDFKNLLTYLKVNHEEISLRHINISNNTHESYRDWINPKSKELIDQYFEFELNYFNYEF